MLAPQFVNTKNRRNPPPPPKMIMVSTLLRPTSPLRTIIDLSSALWFLEYYKVRCWSEQRRKMSNERDMWLWECDKWIYVLTVWMVLSRCWNSPANSAAVSSHQWVQGHCPKKWRKTPLPLLLFLAWRKFSQTLIPILKPLCECTSERSSRECCVSARRLIRLSVLRDPGKWLFLVSDTVSDHVQDNKSKIGYLGWFWNGIYLQS